MRTWLMMQKVKLGARLSTPPPPEETVVQADPLIINLDLVWRAQVPPH